MTGFRKSPLSKDGLNKMLFEPVAKNVIDFSILTQTLTLANKRVVKIDFTIWLDESSSASRKTFIYRIAKALKYRSELSKRADTIYTQYTGFAPYLRFCDNQKIDPFSRFAFFAYCGKDGELMRQITLKNKPLPFVYLYQSGVEIGLTATTAALSISAVKKSLIDAQVFDDRWERDLPKLSNDISPTKPYSQKEFGIILRRLQFLFYSIATQLISSKESGEHLDVVSAVLDEQQDGDIWTIDFKNFNPKVGDVSHLSPFNLAMSAGYFLFAHYSSFNMTSIVNVCHPLEQLSDKKLDRTIRYTKIRASKFRAKKVVQGVFLSETEVDNFVDLEIDKRDGLSFIQTLSKLSTLFIPEHDKKDKPLFYHLNKNGLVVRFNTAQASDVTSSILSIYNEDKSVHSNYLVERFYEVLENQTITEVSVNKGVVDKKTKKLLPSAAKQWIIHMAYAALRSMTDVKLKGIYMPLSYSDVNAKGFVRISYTYDNGQSGFFEVDGRNVPFLKRLEEYSCSYNSLTRSKYKPKRKITPFLLPLGRKNTTYQWHGFELGIDHYLKRIGVTGGSYLILLSAQQFRVTAANNNYNPNDGGLSVARSLTQNTLQTLRDHYINGHPTQNQVIASQAIEILEAYCATGDLQDAKDKVRSSREIDVLEYDVWKKLRQPTNVSGFLCNGTPSGRAETEHRASQKLAKNLLGQNVKIPCYQYDQCIECTSAKLVDDVHSAYKLLSFAELLQESSILMPDRQEELNDRANKLIELAEANLSTNVLDEAEKKLHEDGRYFVHSTDFMNSMETTNYAKAKK